MLVGKRTQNEVKSETKQNKTEHYGNVSIVEKVLEFESGSDRVMGG